MPDDLGLVAGDRPVAGARTRRADAELIVDTPGLWIPGVVGVIEDRDVREIVSAGHLHRGVHPHGALSLGPLVPLPRGVDHFAGDPLAPRHAEKQAAVVVLADGDVGLRFAAPREIQLKGAVLLAHRPALGLGEHGLAALVEQVVDRLPPHLVAGRLQHRRRHAAPELRPGVVEVVAPVEPGESPVQAGLMRVVGGLVFGQDPAAVRRDDRMQVRPLIRPGVLRDEGGASAGPEHGDRPGLRVLPDREALGGRGRRLRLQRPALNARDVKATATSDERCKDQERGDLFHGWLTPRDGSGKVDAGLSGLRVAVPRKVGRSLAPPYDVADQQSSVACARRPAASIPWAGS